LHTFVEFARLCVFLGVSIRQFMLLFIQSKLLSSWRAFARCSSDTHTHGHTHTHTHTHTFARCSSVPFMMTSASFSLSAWETFSKVSALVLLHFYGKSRQRVLLKMSAAISLSHTHTHSLTHSHTHTHRYLSLSLSLSLSHTHTHTLLRRNAINLLLQQCRDWPRARA
jgi:hypothetical protein